jgi:hypothetical protein
MEGDRLAPSGELGAAGLSQFATPDMARGNSVDSSRVVTQHVLCVDRDIGRHNEAQSGC